jgi:pilus assembly protein CpaE
MAELSIVVYSADPAAHGGYVEALEQGGHVSVAGRVVDADELAAAVATHRPDALFVDLGAKPEVVLRALEALGPDRPGFIVTGPWDSQLILHTLRLGAREYLTPGFPREKLDHAVEQLLLQPSRPATTVAALPSARGQLIAVTGAKGGVGTTLVARELAASLHRAGHSTVLADLDLRHGDVALSLDIQPQFTIADVSRRDGELDPTYVHKLLEHHRSGIDVLCAPQRPEDAETLQPESVAATLEFLRADHDWVVADVPRNYDETTLRVLDLAEEIFLVTCLDIPCLHHTRRDLDLLERLGHSAGRIRLIVNRHCRANPVAERDFTEFVGRQPDARIPNDYHAAQESLSFGQAVAEASPKSTLVQAFDGLAADLREWRGIDREPKAAAARPSFMQKFLRRKSHGAH